MSRGFGWVQMACLPVIKKYEEDEEWPTTYDIAAYVYQVEADKDDGYCYVTAAQHVAVKRALEGLQRQGKVIGIAQRFCLHDGGLGLIDKRSGYSYCWMSEKRARQWIRAQGPERAGMVKTFKAKMLAIGMKP